ncbi:hypothetical protein HJ588_04885 [Flexivirga sp. ID2601S]|uniref:Xaa-Pro dipeptidyl-peptidase-like domain-containing protein n=1 Tax=Flexivirga aerilata TaxID=1656889 RepID=A0A849AH55_9MICO|nr:hypothetical protein [Flexivirga aerilata]
MSVTGLLASHVCQRLFRLGRPETRHVTVERGIEVPLGGGVVLRADRWAPEPLPAAAPVMLFLTPYDRGGFQNAISRMVAERGFQALAVSSRGTFGSTAGPFAPVTHDAGDGLAVSTGSAPRTGIRARSCSRVRATSATRNGRLRRAPGTTSSR